MGILNLFRLTEAEGSSKKKESKNQGIGYVARDTGWNSKTDDEPQNSDMQYKYLKAYKTFGIVAKIIDATTEQTVQDFSFEGPNKTKLEKLRKELNIDRHLFRVCKTMLKNGNCLTPDTPVRTQRGFVRIDEIEQGDMVVTPEGKFAEVKNLIENYESEKVLKITTWKNRAMPLRCTDNHKILVIKKDKYKVWMANRRNRNFNDLTTKNDSLYKECKFEWVESKDLSVGDVMVYPKIPYVLEDNKIRFYDFTEKAKSNNHNKELDNIQYVEITPEFLRLAGYYLAEGGVNNGQMRFSFHKCEVDFQQQVVDDIKFCFGIKATLNKAGENCVNVVVSSEVLSKFFVNLFGKGSRNKFIPTIIKNQPPELLKYLVDTHFNGDGCESSNRAYTVSEKLALDLRDVYMRLGRTPAFSYDSRGLGGYEISDSVRNRGSYVDDKYFYFAIRKIEEEEYKGIVYDISVDDESHSFLTVNGIVHNCWVEVVKDKKKIVKLKLLPPEQMVVIRSVKGKVEAYVQQTATRNIIWGKVEGSHSIFNTDKPYLKVGELKDIIHYTFNRQAGDKYGQSLIEPAMRMLNVKFKVENDLPILIERYLAPLIHFKVGNEEKPVTQSQLEDIRDKLKNIYADTEFVTDWTVESSVLGFENKGVFNIKDIMDVIDKDIMAAMGMFPVLTGKTDSGDTKSAEVQLRAEGRHIKAIQRELKTEFEDKFIQAQGIGTDKDELVWEMTDEREVVEHIANVVQLAGAGLITPQKANDLLPKKFHETLPEMDIQTGLGGQPLSQSKKPITNPTDPHQSTQMVSGQRVNRDDHRNPLDKKVKDTGKSQHEVKK